MMQGRTGTMPPHCKERKMTGDAVQMRAEAMNALAHPPLAVPENVIQNCVKTPGNGMDRAVCTQNSPGEGRKTAPGAAAFFRKNGA